jgi:hypothetical protein
MSELGQPRKYSLGAHIIRFAPDSRHLSYGANSETPTVRQTSSRSRCRLPYAVDAGYSGGSDFLNTKSA